MEVWAQNYDPAGNIWLSSLVALIPIAFFFLALAVFRLKGYVAGTITVILALLVAVLFYGMPVDMALASAVYGFFYGLWPIAWIIVGAVFLYKISVKTGQFDIIRSSILSVTEDQRLQMILVGFAFGVGLFGYSALFAPMVTFVSLWFDRRRGTALALVASGQYVAGVLWPTPFERAIAAYGWKATMVGYAAFTVLVIIPIAALVLRPPPAQVTTGAYAFRAQQGGQVLGMAPNLAMGLIAACSFLCCVPMAMPASHLVAFCMDVGIASSHGAAMLSVLLLAACWVRPPKKA